ncbi:hypothetical protein QYF36_011365 [Acer negundo]|nr:hypothetical protein QYF36_011365 [Acer negundo]
MNGWYVVQFLKSCYGKLPSLSCCERVRVSHVECVCPLVTPKLAALIDLNCAIRFIEGCGRRVPRHFKYHNSMKVINVAAFYYNIAQTDQ